MAEGDLDREPDEPGGRTIPFFAVIPLALITWWLYRRLAHATALPRRGKLAVAGILIAMWVLTIFGATSATVLDPTWARFPAYGGLVWLAVVFYLILGLLIVAVGSLVARLVIRRKGGEDAHRTRIHGVRIASVAVVVIAVVTTGYGVVEAARPAVSQTEVTLDRLPTGFDGVRVALISDLHVGPTRDAAFTRRVVDLVRAETPDLIVLGGDLVDGQIELVEEALAPLRDLSAPLGVFAVSGNHEFYGDDAERWLDAWDAMGIRTLRNSRVTLTRNDAEIYLAGIHDATAPEPFEPDLPAALDGRDENTFVLLAAHEPRQAPEASDLGVDLQISGHTHGGQLWPIRYLVPLQQPSVTGLDRIDNTTLYTTRGAGAWGPPVRVGAPPEVTMLTLRSPSR